MPNALELVTWAKSLMALLLPREEFQNFSRRKRTRENFFISEDLHYLVEHKVRHARSLCCYS
jgi:hypothetical protein